MQQLTAELSVFPYYGTALQCHEVVHSSGVEVGKVGDLQRSRYDTGPETELDLVVGVDEIVGVLQDMEMLGTQDTFEAVNADTCCLDVHESVDGAL